MGWSTRTWIAALTLPVFTICAVSLYYFHKRDKQWDEYMNSLQMKTIEIKIPISNVGTLIGRAGTNIKEIQDRTQTRINFENIEGNNEMRICKIKGFKEDVDLAKKIIQEQLISYSSRKTSFMLVPQKSVGRIIGRCGDTIRAITKASGALVNVDRGEAVNDKRKITIRGTDEQIQNAREMIEEKLQEEELAKNGCRDSPRLHDRKKQDCERPKVPPHERLIGTTECMLSVYVSSVADPSNFWIQLLSSQSVNLDHLVERMSDYYNKPENRDAHKLKEVYPGQIVVSRFEHDDKWYRVKVYDVEADPSCPQQSKVDVFYCDYGDSSYVPLGHLLSIHPSFLELNFQAIEASMAGIQPRDGRDKWDQEATDAFEDMVFLAQWKALLAQIVYYREVKVSSTGETQVPVIRLYYPPSKEVEEGLEIGAKMVQDGFAVPTSVPDPRPPPGSTIPPVLPLNSSTATQVESMVISSPDSGLDTASNSVFEATSNSGLEATSNSGLEAASNSGLEATSNSGLDSDSALEEHLSSVDKNVEVCQEAVENAPMNDERM